MDTPDAETFLRDWFVELGLAPLPVEWVADMRQGVALAEKEPWPRWATSVCGMPRTGIVVTVARALGVQEPRATVSWSGTGTFDLSEPSMAHDRSVLRPAEWNDLPSLAAVPDWPNAWPYDCAPLHAPAPLWAMWIRRHAVLACPAPALSVNPVGQLHRVDGPAVQWSDGTGFYFWRGTHVPEAVIVAPDTIPFVEILSTHNQEVRRAMMERIGYDRVLVELGGQPIQHDKCGALYSIRLPGEIEPVMLVHVTNATPEPDGSVKKYVLRVPPAVRHRPMETARQAVAWTFGMNEKDYTPEVQT